MYRRLRALVAPRRREPYRYLMKNCAQLMETQAWLEARLKGQKLPKPAMD